MPVGEQASTSALNSGEMAGLVATVVLYGRALLLRTACQSALTRHTRRRHPQTADSLASRRYPPQHRLTREGS